MRHLIQSNVASWMRKHFLAVPVTLPLVLLATALGACTKPKPSILEKLGGDEPGIFSNRPTNLTEFIAILKLQTPALLSSVQKTNGKSQIDADLAKQIEAEQIQTIADLKKMSPDIRILFRYKMVLNGIAIVAPLSLLDQIRANMRVAYIEQEGVFGRPILQIAITGTTSTLAERNSVKFIGADKVHQLTIKASDGSEIPVDGRGLKVGIIDTGIDYTHAMFGGTGTVDAYKAIDPTKANGAFPSKKVVGGIDLVGTAYDSASGDYSKHLPIPDENPLDEAGHGSHVAGTVAGIGDDQETYSGVAPGAALYAIKVFGAAGSTGDAVVVAGLEFAADPNQDGLLDDQLDVVNLSLGSSYGNPHILYGEAMHNLSFGGTVVVASAGNSGNKDYIVGAPSVADEAISVAASIDDGFHNWQFRAVVFHTKAGDKISEAVEGPVSKPIVDAGPVNGKLVFVGIADQDFSPEMAAQIKGNVAFIDRGKVTFAEKVRRAFDGGAIGVVVGNNQPGNPFAMGGEGHFEIPAIMISQTLADELKEQMKVGDVLIDFQTDLKIDKPELIDTLTDFSSKGPRSMDALMKPEISAPGSNVISAAMGQGNKGVKFSGTSMAGPHVAGVMALLKQSHPDMTSAELKSILMGHGKSIGDETKQNYLLTRQGAGRVQTLESALAILVADRTAISLGEVNIEGQKAMRESVQIKNISKDAISLNLSLDSMAGLSLSSGSMDITLAAGESKEVALRFTLDAAKVVAATAELDGLLKFSQEGKEIHRIPVLAMVKKISQIKGTSVNVQAASPASGVGAAVDLLMQNKGSFEGVVLPFNLLGQDLRKQDAQHDPYLSKACDLQAAGYRIVEKTVDTHKIQVLQIAAKVFEPMTTWNACEVSVLIDSNGDQVADQELAGITRGNVKGLFTATNEAEFVSVLLDAPKTRELRSKFEQEALAGKKAEEDYSTAVVDEQTIMVFDHSTVVVVEADISKLARRPNGQLAIKVATIFNEASSVEMDDFLGNEARQWKNISLDQKSQSFVGLPESIKLKAGETRKSSFDKGEGDAKLLLLMPDNRGGFSDLVKDDQLQVMTPRYQK